MPENNNLTDEVHDIFGIQSVFRLRCDALFVNDAVNKDIQDLRYPLPSRIIF